MMTVLPFLPHRRCGLTTFREGAIRSMTLRLFQRCRRGWIVLKMAGAAVNGIIQAASTCPFHRRFSSTLKIRPRVEGPTGTMMGARSPRRERRAETVGRVHCNSADPVITDVFCTSKSAVPSQSVYWIASKVGNVALWKFHIHHTAKNCIHGPLRCHDLLSSGYFAAQRFCAAHNV